jgi:histone-lysine N-methyltransferase SETMAR
LREWFWWMWWPEVRQFGRIHQNRKKLKQCYQRVRPNRNAGDMLIQHDNARPHTSLRSQEAIAKFGWTVLPHPPYSPDLAP